MKWHVLTAPVYYPTNSYLAAVLFVDVMARTLMHAAACFQGVSQGRNVLIAGSPVNSIGVIL